MLLVPAAVLLLAGTPVPAPLPPTARLGRPAVCWVPNACAHSFDTKKRPSPGVKRHVVHRYTARCYCRASRACPRGAISLNIRLAPHGLRRI